MSCIHFSKITGGGEAFGPGFEVDDHVSQRVAEVVRAVFDGLLALRIIYIEVVAPHRFDQSFASWVYAQRVPIQPTSDSLDPVTQ